MKCKKNDLFSPLQQHFPFDRQLLRENEIINDTATVFGRNSVYGAGFDRHSVFGDGDDGTSTAIGPRRDDEARRLGGVELTQLGYPLENDASGDYTSEELRLREIDEDFIPRAHLPTPRQGHQWVLKPRYNWRNGRNHKKYYREDRINGTSYNPQASREVNEARAERNRLELQRERALLEAARLAALTADSELEAGRARAERVRLELEAENARLEAAKGNSSTTD